MISARSERSRVHPPVEAKKPSALKNDGESGGKAAANVQKVPKKVVQNCTYNTMYRSNQ